jgi:hypothetical protein
MTPSELDEFKIFLDERFKAHKEMQDMKFDHLESIMSSRLHNIDNYVEDHHSTLFGNGNIGLKIKVDRMAVEQKGLMRVFSIATGIMVALGAWMGFK